MRRKPAGGHQLFFDLGRKDIYAAQDDHIVRPAGDFLHPAHAPRGSRQKTGQVAGAIADHRQTFFGQGREHQFAHLTVLNDLTGLRIDDFGIEVIFPNVQTVFGFHTFIRHTRSHDFGQAIDINRMHIKGLFHFLAHGVGPGFCPKHAHIQ